MQIVEIWGFHNRVVSCFTTPYQLVAGCTHILEEIAGFEWSQHFFSATLEPAHHYTRYHRTIKLWTLSLFSNLTVHATSFLSGFIAISIRGKAGKVALVQALRLCASRTAHRGSKAIALLFLDHGTRRGEGSASRPGRSLPPGKTRYPLYRRLGGPHGRSGQVRNISPLPGFDHRTVQPVASCYTDYATRSTISTRISRQKIYSSLEGLYQILDQYTVQEKSSYLYEKNTLVIISLVFLYIRVMETGMA